MLKVRNTFCLDHLKDKNGSDLPVWSGLVINKIKVDGNVVPLAKIKYNMHRDSCFMQTVDDNFQTYVVLYEQFQDFIYLVDEAYYLIELINRSFFKKKQEE